RRAWGTTRHARPAWSSRGHRPAPAQDVEHAADQEQQRGGTRQWAGRRAGGRERATGRVPATTGAAARAVTALARAVTAVARAVLPFRAVRRLDVDHVGPGRPEELTLPLLKEVLKSVAAQALDDVGAGLHLLCRAGFDRVTVQQPPHAER